MALNAGLGLVESPDVKVPHTDDRNIYVPVYNMDWEDDSDEEIEWWGSFIHEMYHQDKSKGNDKHMKMKARLAKEKDMKVSKLWVSGTNIFEDVRIEHNAYGEFEGQDRIMEKRKTLYVPKIKKMLAESTAPTNPKEDACFILMLSSFAQWNKGMLGEDVESWAWSDAAKEMWGKIKHLLPTVSSITEVEQPFELMEEIISILGDDPPSEEEGRKINGKGDPSKDKKDDGSESSLSDLIVHKHDIPDTDEKGPPRDVRYMYEDSPHVGSFPGIPLEEVQAKKLPPGRSEITSAILANMSHEGMAGQIKRYLQVKAQVRLQGGYKRGVLDSGALWKGVVYRGTKAGETVFKQKEQALSLHTAVTLLVDQSGSMNSRNKFVFASAAACSLNEVFAKVGVKCRVASFSDTREMTLAFVHKDFDEKVTKEKLAERMSAGWEYMASGNADGENILWEYTHLIARDEPKKILIVLSDGMPADSKGKYNVTNHTLNVCAAIEKQRKVSLIGIGILDKSVQRFYKNHKIIDSVINIESTLLDLLKKEVLHA